MNCQPLEKNTQDCLKTLAMPPMPLLSGNDVEEKRQEILQYFHDSFTLYESLYDCLASDESFYTRPNNLRHPLIFYYGHTSVFFINKLNVMGLLDERISPAMESLFAIGVDEMSWDDLDDTDYGWSSVAEVKAHRNKTRDIVDKFIRKLDFTLPISWDDPMWVILMGIEHEKIHLETTAVLIRELPLEQVKQHEFWGQICTERGNAPQNELLSVDGGAIHLGKEQPSSIYGWDNEYGSHEEIIKPFKASKYLVSNQEFLGFVEADGYNCEEYWTDEGWRWVQFTKAKQPNYWRNDGKDYLYRTMLEETPMPWNHPVDINYLEAKAFCNWKSENEGKHIRMPSEAEWHKLRQLEPSDLHDWQQAPANINLAHYKSSCPVDMFAFAGGFFDIIGNVWQWTETPIDGFNGFEPHPVYDDFSTPTFDGKHNLFKGGCWVSTGNYAIKDSRYAFRRHFFQYSGLRYIEAEPLPEQKTNSYESDLIVSQYIEFHYGDNYFDVPNFSVSCVQKALEVTAGQKTERALDI